MDMNEITNQTFKFKQSTRIILIECSVNHAESYGIFVTILSL